MAMYEYYCEKCDTKFEDIRSHKEPNPPCPKCKSEVKRLISAGKFYITGPGVHKPGMN